MGIEPTVLDLQGKRKVSGWGESKAVRDRFRQLAVHNASLPVEAALLELVHGHWGAENGLHCTSRIQCREDNGCLRMGYGPAVMGILRRAALNIVCTVQQNCSTDVSISLLCDQIGRHPWVLAAALP